MKHVALFIATALCCPLALAKLPAPTDAAKAAAAEAGAKTAHGNKVADFQLCKSMDKVAAHYFGDAKKAGKESKPATATAPCADPGPFAMAPPAAPAGPAAAPTAAPAAAPVAAPAAAPPKKP